MSWQRLSPRMLLVHPVHELLRQLPLLVGGIVLGSTTGNPLWALAALAVTALLGVARWFTTGYRIEADEVQLRTGVLQRKVLSLPRNRIRSVQTDARLLHRLLGLAVLRVSTGREAKGDSVFELDAVEVAQVPRLRAILLNESLQAPAVAEQPAPELVLARWQPSWLRFAPLSVSGLVMIGAAVGGIYQTGVGVALQHSRVAQSGLNAVERSGVVAMVMVLTVVVLLASVVLAVLRSLATYGNLVLTRRAEVLHLRHGLLRVREHTYDMSRLRGGTLRQPLLVRMFGGARLDAVMTGVGGAGESSMLLPPCPVHTAVSVLTALVGDAGPATGPLRGHGRRAALRRWTRALGLPAAAGLALVALTATVGVAPWLWLGWAVLMGCGALLAADRVRALGHRVDGGWLVAQAGSLERRRDCVAAAGIIGWTVRQTLPQRRAGVATLVAATAAGTKRYHLIDVPERLAWTIAAQASPWVAESRWAVV
ncbi:membrane protein [Mycobacterium heckeshornense]|uniref:Membrane protein n=2 Tax=Mycobacterium heckeshornense TaxID=110505 RepID=A0A7R7GXK1_9MYCO|nr:membrane protein [Mycobacterium heckeshornense]